ncbi:MAG: Nif3-like dinuclear metal center hexameric protein [Promethearchaeota archaeon]
MYLKEIMNVLENDIAPKTYLIDSEPYGFHYGIRKEGTIVRRVMLTIGLNIESIQFALKNNITLIITHYGLLNTTNFHFSRNLIRKITLLSKKPIFIFVLGLPFTAAKDGISDIIVNTLFLEKKEMFSIKNKKEIEIPIGRICTPSFYLNDSKNLTLKELLIRAKKNFNMQNISFVGNLNQSMTKILVLAHNLIDLELFERIIEEGIDCCVLYKTTHLIANQALDENISLIELSHSKVELFALRKLLNILNLRFPNDDFFLFESQDPFKFL